MPLRAAHHPCSWGKGQGILRSSRHQANLELTELVSRGAGLFFVYLQTK